ncbi:MAG: septum formation initiator family protein [Myxococcota bacterium]
MFSLLPALALVVLASSALWGDSGLLARYGLRARLDASNADLAALERENQRLVRELVILDRDPRMMERQVAEELGWARPGSTVYRFEGSAGAAASADVGSPPAGARAAFGLRPGAEDRPAGSRPLD